MKLNRLRPFVVFTLKFHVIRPGDDGLRQTVFIAVLNSRGQS